MPLSDDQKAMLRLLAQREQGYDDLAALMGLSVEEVRAKVAAALAQLEEEGEAPPPLPPEPEPEPVEEPPPPLPDEPVAAASPAPDPEPAKPAARAEAPAPRSKPASEPAQRPGIALPRSGGARAALAAGIAVVLLVVVVLALGDDGDSGETTTASGADGGAAQTTSNPTVDGKEVTQAVLSPVDGGDASGVVTFGRVKNSLALQIEATGLEPTDRGESYTIWLYQSPAKMLPLASTRVDKSGKIGAQVEVPAEVLAYLAQETFSQIDISLTTDATLKASLAKATREKKAPVYTGADVLRGPITGPIVGASR